MKAIVLSAGQGRRLLPLTAEQPKCLLPVFGSEPALGLQLRALARAGLARAVVVVGFGADAVEDYLAAHPIPGLAVETLYNPFYGSSDNLVTCWLARGAMDDDFLLINGDTLFEDSLLQRVLAAPEVPVAVTVDHKLEYDDDDMKVALDVRGRLVAIGKTLSPPTVGAESIGLLSFRGSGPKLFVGALEAAVRKPRALQHWYLSVVNELAQTHPIDTISIRGHWWREIDSPEDLALVRNELESRRTSG
jgi:choline kinase